jgi:PKHD-type hydroxylase
MFARGSESADRAEDEPVRSAYALAVAEQRDAVAGFLVAKGLFDGPTCRNILAAAGDSAASGAVVGAAHDGAVVRRSEVRWLTVGDVARDATDRLLAVVRALSKDYFGFALDGAEALQVATYGEGDGYGWHIDLGPGAASRRKLSVTVLLTDPSEFDGGAFELGVIEGVPVTLGLGDAVVFPSYLRHRVAPVTRGERTSLAAWITGPPFC